MVYTNQKGAYKATPHPHLGLFDHISVMLMQIYKPRVKLVKLVSKQIRVWPEGATSALQDCFERTKWNFFQEAPTYSNHIDLPDYSDIVTAYISECMDPNPSLCAPTINHG